jgi:molybdate transport system substrate-binding protein
LFSRIVLLALVMCSVFVFAQEITVAAAADLSTALPEIVAAYTKQTSQAVKLTFGASGNLTTQIQNGAPFDVFFSADESYPAQLIEKGLAERDSLYRYGIGRLVLWVPNDIPIDVQKLGIKSLLEPSIKKIAIANPLHAPYGRAAEAALKKLGVHEQVAPKLVLGENISQTAQFVESGNAQAGMLALSHALSPNLRDKGHYWTVPLDAYPTLNQAAVVISKSTQKDAARKFLDFVRGPEGTTLLKNSGFSLPAETH